MQTEKSELYRLIKTADDGGPELLNHERRITELRKKKRNPLALYRDLASDLRHWDAEHHPNRKWSTVARCMADDLDKELDKAPPDLDRLYAILETRRKPTLKDVISIPASEVIIPGPKGEEIQASLLLAFLCEDYMLEIPRTNEGRLGLIDKFRQEGHIAELELSPEVFEQVIELFMLHTETGFANAFDAARRQHNSTLDVDFLRMLAEGGDKLCREELAERERIGHLKTKAGTTVNLMHRFFVLPPKTS